MRQLKNEAHHDIMEVVDGVLIRDKCPKRGQPYMHVCDLESFTEICHTIDERNDRPFTGNDLVGWTDLPYTQIYTALAFLKEIGSIKVVSNRKSAAAVDDVYLDAMIEWHASDAKTSNHYLS